MNNYTDDGNMNNIQGDVAGNAANAGVGSTTSFAGVAVAAEGWLPIIFEIRNTILYMHTGCRARDRCSDGTLRICDAKLLLVYRQLGRVY